MTIHAQLGEWSQAPWIYNCLLEAGHLFAPLDSQVPCKVFRALDKSVHCSLLRDMNFLFLPLLSRFPLYILDVLQVVALGSLDAGF